MLRQPSIVRIRNIASHDYEALNWGIVKSGCQRITESYNEAYHKESIEVLENAAESEVITELTDILDNEN